MAKPRKTTTLAGEAYDKLRAELLSCRLLPGDPIKINEVSDQLYTNPIAVREALSKLSAEGLVTSEPQKGFRAASVSAAALRDLTRVRIEIESACLRGAIAHGDVGWETEIVGALHRLLRTPLRVETDPQRNTDEWAAAHSRYHEVLVSACDSPLLLWMRHILFAQAERYRRLSVPLAEFDRDLDGEHRELAAAVVARDTTAALLIISRHLQTTTDILLRNELLFTRATPAKRHAGFAAEPKSAQLQASRF